MFAACICFFVICVCVWCSDVCGDVAVCRGENFVIASGKTGKHSTRSTYCMMLSEKRRNDKLAGRAILYDMRRDIIVTRHKLVVQIQVSPIRSWALPQKPNGVMPRENGVHG